MTTAQAALYARATKRAQAQGVHVVFQGKRKFDGARVLVVNSATEANKYYSVAVVERELVCDCQAAKSGHYCKHRAAARRFLADERANRPLNIWMGR